MPASRLHALLDEHGVAYTVDDHDLAYGAQELAAVEHVSGWDVAKTVILKVGDDLAMLVVPASVEVDLDKARSVLGGNVVRLANEEEFAAAFPDCDVGAQPPFGNLYGVPTFVDESLRRRGRIVCRDGSHTQTVTLATEDYLRLVRPEIVDVAGAPA